MKILQAIYQFKTGGGSLQVTVDLATAARNSGHSVTLLARDVPISATVGAERFFSGNKAWDWWRLWQRCKQQQYDMIHVHDRYCSLLVSLIPQPAPTVQTNHIAYRTHRRLTRLADCVVGCSQSMDRHHAEFFGLPPSRRRVIPNGIVIRPPNLTQAQRLQDNIASQLRDRQICLTVARLSQQKGHTYLLEAIARLPSQLRQSWCFVFAGDGELAEQLQYQAVTLGIFQDVIFLGMSQDIPEWLALAKAFVLPSLYEGLPLALLEAMAAGLPCLATAVDGNAEAIRHTENGLLCNAADPHDLAQALEQLLSDERLRIRCGCQARIDYHRHWTIARTWQQYEALYNQLIHQATNRYALYHAQ